MQDLSDLANNGLNDLFEYGLEFTTGLALSDGSKKDSNKTEEVKEKTFAEKYREELKKDFSDLGIDDDDLLKFDDNDDESDPNELKPEDTADTTADTLDLDALMGDDEEEEEPEAKVLKEESKAEPAAKKEEFEIEEEALSKVLKEEPKAKEEEPEAKKEEVEIKEEVPKTGKQTS